jgi:hypothetical protein
MQSRLGQDADLNALFSRAMVDLSRLSPDERIRFGWSLYEMFGALEFMFHQSQVGAIPDEIWVRWNDTMAWWLSHPGIQSWWRAKPAPFSRSFSSYIDELLARNPVDEAAARRWQAFVREADPTDL